MGKPTVYYEEIASRRLIEWDGDTPRMGASEPVWGSAASIRYECWACGEAVTLDQARWLVAALGDGADPEAVIR